jgi:spermidine synthase
MNIFFGFFFLSGFCSLVYQVVWLRVAMAGFGVTTPLVSIVLSIFMAGLALGSWAGGYVVRSRERRPAGFFIALYAATELVIGISGLAVAPLLRAARTWLSNQAASSSGAWGSPGYYLASAALIGCILLPFCTLMGATFPLAMAAIRAAYRERSSTSFSYLYLANVLGAMAGALGSAFVLIELLGFTKTLWLAAALNAVIAATALALAFARRDAPGAPVAVQAPAASAIPIPATDLPVGGALPLLFTSGLASLGMEVVWTRQFMPILGSLVYSFAAILAVYLAATAVGSRFYRIWIEEQRARAESFAQAAAAILAGACAFLPLLTTDPRIHHHTNLRAALLLIGGIGPFCAVAGFMTPMLVDRWSRGNPNRAGRAYAVNAVGCILGPLLAGFVLLPAVGERWALVVLALPFFGFGVWSLAGSSGAREGGSRRALGKLLAAAAVASVLLVMLTRNFETLFPEARVRRDYTATSIAAGRGMDRELLINGIGITNLTPITNGVPARAPAQRACSVLRHGNVLPVRLVVGCAGDGGGTGAQRAVAIRLFPRRRRPADAIPAFTCGHRRCPAVSRAHARVLRRDRHRSAAAGSGGRLQPPVFDRVLPGSAAPPASRRHLAAVAAGRGRGRQVGVRPILAAQFSGCARVPFDRGLGLPFSGRQLAHEQASGGDPCRASATRRGARSLRVGSRSDRGEPA